MYTGLNCRDETVDKTREKRRGVGKEKGKADDTEM